MRSFGIVLALVPSLAVASAEITTVTYTCERGAQVVATYINEGPQSYAVVLAEGRQIGLTISESASGARYASDTGEVWWTKGPEAMLLIGPDETQVYMDCRAN